MVEALGRAQEVGVEFFPVGGEGAGDVAVVGPVPEAVDGVGAACEVSESRFTR
jgi:hypothetical protein